jgi:hypothetical protein
MKLGNRECPLTKSALALIVALGTPLREPGFWHREKILLPGPTTTLRIKFGFRNKIPPESPFFHTSKETYSAAYTPYAF